MDTLDEATLQRLFPSFRRDEFKNCSPPTNAYNCLAWAVGATDTWWEPVVQAGYYWPPELPLKYDIEVALQLFRNRGFVDCDSAQAEEGYEKVAVYSDGTEYTHAARQLEDGRWTSKIGAHQDLEHISLDCFLGDEYGTTVHVMKRAKSVGSS